MISEVVKGEEHAIDGIRWVEDYDAGRPRIWDPQAVVGRAVGTDRMRIRRIPYHSHFTIFPL